MNIRQAILKAADHIEAHPEAFDFSDIAVPECGAPGCAIGWVAAFSGKEFRRTGCGTQPHHKETIARVHDDEGVCGVVFGCGHNDFYDRMKHFDEGWLISAKSCARALRLYADKFHPAAPIRYPDWSAIATASTVTP